MEQNQIVKRTVITQTLGKNENLAVNYNGVDCTTPDQRIAALRQHYRLSVLRKYGIVMRDDEGTPVKNVLIVNETLVKVKLPSALTDEVDGSITETLEEYYERTRVKASGAYRTFMKGLERIDFLANMD